MVPVISNMRSVVLGGAALAFSELAMTPTLAYMMESKANNPKLLKSLEDEADKAKLDYKKDGYDVLEVGEKIDKLQAMIEEKMISVNECFKNNYSSPAEGIPFIRAYSAAVFEL